VKFSFNKDELALLAVVLAASALVRVLLFPLKGYPIDTNDFMYWFDTAATHGIRPFYIVASFADYPPFNVYIFWLFGSLANAAHFPMGTMVKVVPNLFDLAISGLIYFFVRKQASNKIALIATVVYAFNPAVIFNSAVWGQFDSIYTFFLVLSLILALKSKPELSAASFALGILTKPQGIALAPLVAFLIYKKCGLKKFLFSIGVFAVVVFLVILPFQWSNPVTFLSDIYFGGYSYYHYTSVNAFNLWGLFGFWVPDGNLVYVGWTMFGGLAAFTLYVLNKRFKVSGDMLVIFSAFILLFGFFMLPTRIHERYLFPAIAVLALMLPFVKKTRTLYILVSATFFANISYVLYWLNDYADQGLPYTPNLSGDPVALAVCIVNLVTFLYAILLMIAEFRGRTWVTQKAPKVTTAGTDLGADLDKPTLGLDG
jgi:Gpi18-like mannosyltransferase